MSNIRQYLYILRATGTEMLESGPTPEEARIIAQHAAYLERLAPRSSTAGKAIQSILKGLQRHSTSPGDDA